MSSRTLYFTPYDMNRVTAYHAHFIGKVKKQYCSKFYRAYSNQNVFIIALLVTALKTEKLKSVQLMQALLWVDGSSATFLRTTIFMSWHSK